MDFLTVRRARRAFAEADHGGVRRRLEGVGLLLGLPAERRGRRLPLLHEQLLLAVVQDSAVALTEAARLAGRYPDVLTDSFLDDALRRWLAEGRLPTAAEAAELDRQLTGTGRGLRARLTALCADPSRPPLAPARRDGLADLVIGLDLADPPLELLLLLGPLDEADWWCELGHLAIQESRDDLARAFLRRAAELGCTEVRPYAAYLEYAQIEYAQDAWEDDEEDWEAQVRDEEAGAHGTGAASDVPEDSVHAARSRARQRVRQALITARELQPAPGPDFLLYLHCRALSWELPADLDELASLDVERTDLREFWLAVAALQDGRDTEAGRRLRAALDSYPDTDRSDRGWAFDPDEDQVQSLAEELLLLLARELPEEARRLLTRRRLDPLVPDYYRFHPGSLRSRATTQSDAPLREHCS